MHLAHSIRDRGRNGMLLSRRPEFHDVLHDEVSKAMTAQAEHIVQQLSDERPHLVRATVFDQSLHDTTSILMLGNDERPVGVLHYLIDDELHFVRTKHGDDLLQHVVCVSASNAIPHVRLQCFGDGQTPGVAALVQGFLQVSARHAVTCHVPGTVEIGVRGHGNLHKITQAMLEAIPGNKLRKQIRQ